MSVGGLEGKVFVLPLQPTPVPSDLAKLPQVVLDILATSKHVVGGNQLVTFETTGETFMADPTGQGHYIARRVPSDWQKHLIYYFREEVPLPSRTGRSRSLREGEAAVFVHRGENGKRMIAAVFADASHVPVVSQLSQPRRRVLDTLVAKVYDISDFFLP